MKAHELAKQLLAGPNVPVVINGWGSDEGSTFEVSEISELGTCSFNGVNDTARTPRNSMGYNKDRKCVCLQHGAHTPPSTSQILARVERENRIKRDREQLSPRAFTMKYAEIRPLTPADIEQLSKEEATK